MEAAVKKNDQVEVTIEDIGSDGEGIGKYKGYTLFIKDTVVGDKALVKVMKTGKTYGYARLVELITPSGSRIQPRCPIADKCGGCQLQHMDYKKQLEYKENKVRNCLTRIGGFTKIPMEPICGMEEPYYYRNKSQFPVGRKKDGTLSIGFYAGRTHSIIDTQHCYIGAKVNVDILKFMRTFIEQYHIEPYDEETHKGLLRHILTRVGFQTGEIMVCLVINGNNLPHREKLVEGLKNIQGMKSICLNINTSKTNVILGDKVIPIWGEPYITDSIGPIKYQISPLSFYQVNPEQTKKLYELALQYADLHGDEIVWDLYCGIGTISLFLAQKAKKVYGVEIIPQAIEDAKTNARINGIDNAEFYVGAAEEVLPRMYKEKKVKADVIVVDPPRKGCDQSLLDTILEMGPKRVVYVSCDPATLARDLKYLCEKDYDLVKVQAVDQFGHSVHVETVVLLSKKN
ncbi:23S rRNA (uracil(1939)-C(5))-methyltransferase RlmD [Mobilitalea sibirica]|uniref:23S rRNA (Uracil(1939)-C(5))-methyltransferase RlmD n=1 Tax=Mobilitalea sibirica TaxID=1462919 RepID=A0A8J7H939_9FIRM|nr:23S rRNA (uracil(1939)-C(5))-methyltransferase RlmD [Mobilitalea sibirica]MBH1940760.1 23S rRNA (uracil(1939)-C(5))-methyltransferase RlmD [Mobilitalea sibirica]